MAPENSSRIPADLRASICKLRVLCVGNGGMIGRGGRLWSHRFNGAFLAEMGGLVKEIVFCNWLDNGDDPLCQTDLGTMSGVRPLGLPPITGGFLRKGINGLRALAILTRELARTHFVYLYWPGRLPWIVSGLCRAVGKPYGIYLRGELDLLSPNFQEAFRHARFVLTTGETLRRAVESHCSAVENVTPMTSLQPDHILPPRLPSQSGSWDLLYVGRLEERKGVYDLLEAVSYLEEWHHSFTLTLVGHCLDPAGLLGQLPPAVAARVRLPGVIADFESLIPFYRAADAFIVPSHDEGFPRVLYEAMAFGVPILTTFVGSIPSVMKDADNCLEIKVRNPLDIAAKIRGLMTRIDLQTALAASGHRCIAKLMKSWQRSHAMQVAERLGQWVAEAGRRP